jgi:hypothetical protein
MYKYYPLINHFFFGVYSSLQDILMNFENKRVAILNKEIFFVKNKK